jgi:hypothetical protein
VHEWAAQRLSPTSRANPARRRATISRQGTPEMRQPRRERSLAPHSGARNADLFLPAIGNAIRGVAEKLQRRFEPQPASIPFNAEHERVRFLGMSASQSKSVWLLEREMFADGHAALAAAIHENGGRIVDWSDTWWAEKRPPALHDELVVFHGSLGNAAKIVEQMPRRPGAFCNVSQLSCSHYVPLLNDHAVQRNGIFCTVQALVNEHKTLLENWPSSTIFVRPDSPLKPFSGRVIERSAISLTALDYGFYYDDTNLPIFVCPPRAIGREWRFVVVGNNVVAHSSYLASDRSPDCASPPREAVQLADFIARSLPVSDLAFMIDIAEVEDELGILELNAFSGFDLYACDRNAIVHAIHEALMVA